MTTLEKVKQMEQYLANDDIPVDPFLSQTIDKLMQREASRLDAL